MSDYFSIAATFSPHPCFPQRVFLPLHEGQKPACLPTCPTDPPLPSPVTHTDDAMPDLLEDEPGPFVYALVHGHDSSDSTDSGELLYQPPPRARSHADPAPGRHTAIPGNDEVRDGAPAASNGALVRLPPTSTPRSTDRFPGDSREHSVAGAAQYREHYAKGSSDSAFANASEHSPIVLVVFRNVLGGSLTLAGPPAADCVRAVFPVLSHHGECCLWTLRPGAGSRSARAPSSDPRRANHCSKEHHLHQQQ